jgi:hypothetical protein
MQGVLLQSQDSDTGLFNSKTLLLTIVFSIFKNLENVTKMVVHLCEIFLPPILSLPLPSSPFPQKNLCFYVLVSSLSVTLGHLPFKVDGYLCHSQTLQTLNPGQPVSEGYENSTIKIVCSLRPIGKGEQVLEKRLDQKELT